jgi:carbon starvation protein
MRPHECGCECALGTANRGFGAVALVLVTDAVNPTEKVKGLCLVVATACIYVLVYRFYGRWLATQVVGLNNPHVTPAVRLNYGVQYSPGSERM